MLEENFAGLIKIEVRTMLKKIIFYFLIMGMIVSCASTITFTTADTTISGDITDLSKQNSLKVYLLSYQDGINLAYTICHEYFPNDYVEILDGNRGVRLEHKSFFSGDVALNIYPYAVKNLEEGVDEKFKYGVIYKMTYENLHSNPSVNPWYIRDSYLKKLRKHVKYYNIPTAEFKSYQIVF